MFLKFQKLFTKTFRFECREIDTENFQVLWKTLKNLSSCDRLEQTIVLT